MKSLRVLATLAVCVFSAAASADEFSLKLKPGPGQETVQNNCAACHSLDYILTNAPYLNDAGWKAEVTKMISVFGASINEADAKSIGDYLTKNYGS